MTCDRHETGPGSETCPDCLFALVVETRRALNESEAWAESQEREVDALRSRAEAAEQARERQRSEQAISQAEADLAAEERWAARSADLAARVAAIREGLGESGFEDWRRVVEALFRPRDVLLFPDGRLELHGLVTVGSELAPVTLTAHARRG